VKSEGLELRDVALLGRTLAEYVEFFSLRDLDLRAEKFLDAASGVSSFCAEAAMQGFDVTCADPIYGLPARAIERKCRADLEEVVSQLPGVGHKYNWDYYRDVGHLISYREAACRSFLTHYRGSPRRYVKAALPELPFRDGEFTVGLVSHFLFLYEDRFGYDFHRDSVNELARVTEKEVRIYPLTNLRAGRSAHVERLIADEACSHLSFEVRKISFEFVKGADELLIIRKASA
jgi:hypothetical protein